MGKGKLYIVSTPIGNMEDITLRAINILKSVDYIGVEDTRHSALLLKKFEINTSIISFHEHNESRRSEEILIKLLNSNDIAIISDAGTPAINDPGYRLISEVVKHGIKVVPIPGASSVLAALVGSGFPTDRFTFEGFLPRKKGRKTRFEDLCKEQRTVVFFESPHRVEKTLADCLKFFGNREIVLAREMTKMFEEFHRGTISELIEYFAQEPPRGEFVFVLKPEKIKKEKINKYAQK